MNLNCDIVMDLVSLYKDGATSEVTNAAIEDHLEECRACRVYYRHYGSINQRMGHGKSSPGSVESNEGEDLEKILALSSALRTRRILTVAGFTLAGILTASSVALSVLTLKGMLGGFQGKNK